MTDVARSGQPQRILLVDDDPTILLLGREALEQSGFQVWEAADGAEGFRIFQNIHPDIVILDIMMPVMDGYELCRQIRRHDRGHELPVLMMTGWDDLESIRQAYEAGATDFLTKPVNWLVLPHRVRYMLRGSETLINLSLSEARLLHAQRIAHLVSWEWNLVQDRLELSREVSPLFTSDPQHFTARYKEFLSSWALLTSGAVSAPGEQLKTDHRIELPDGTVRHVTSEAEVILDRDQRPVRVVGTIQDITERKRAEERIRFLAYFDNLTNLPNRTLFMERVERALTNRQGKKVAVLFIDLDRFKTINDTMGHGVGDLLLQRVATRLLRAVRKIDLVSRPCSEEGEKVIARFGGDEFIVLLEFITAAIDAAKVAQRILEELSVPYKIGGDELFVTASIGISVWPDDGQDADTLLRNADMAMYHAKENGRNNFQYFDASLNRCAQERLQLETNLRRALARGEFTLHYQPKIMLPKGAIYGVEALVRWDSPDLGRVSPGTFIPLAEEINLISAIDDWVLEEACRQLKEWEEGGYTLSMAVNISGRDVSRHNRLFEKTTDLIARYGVQPQNIELEITEGVFMGNAERTLETFAELRGLGVRLAIDDFGTGFSSLSYLTRYPVNTIKIDRSFIKEIVTDTGAAAVVKAIITLAQNLDISLVAEGVETREQMDFLIGLGCTEMQGYYLGVPVPADVITRQLEASQ